MRTATIYIEREGVEHEVEVSGNVSGMKATRVCIERGHACNHWEDARPEAEVVSATVNGVEIDLNDEETEKAEEALIEAEQSAIEEGMDPS